MEEIIRLENASVTFRKKGGATSTYITAIDGIQLRISQGEFIGIIGPSGSGKSTLIRCINGLQSLDEGRIYFKGQDITHHTQKELREVRHQMGMIFQQHQLINRLTVSQNLLSGLFGTLSFWQVLLNRIPNRECENVRMLADELGIVDQWDKSIRELSGGQQQRVAIGRALAQNPLVLLADEPLSSLDEGRARDIMDRLAYLNRERGLTIVMNIHHVALIRQYASRIIGLNHGKVWFEGKPTELSAQIRAALFQLD